MQTDLKKKKKKTKPKPQPVEETPPTLDEWLVMHGYPVFDENPYEIIPDPDERDQDIEDVWYEPYDGFDPSV